MVSLVVFGDSNTTSRVPNTECQHTLIIVRLFSFPCFSFPFWRGQFDRPNNKKKKKDWKHWAPPPQNRSTMVLLLLKIMIAQNELSNTLHINKQTSQNAMESHLQIDLCVIEWTLKFLLNIKITLSFILSYYFVWWVLTSNAILK